jgi:signal peptidase I
MKNNRRLALVTAVLAFASLTLSVRAGYDRPVAPVGAIQALADARALASQHAALKVMQVEGVSMLPYFGPGSVLVVKPVATARLREGMIAVYVNRFGEKIAHRLEKHNADGWEARGYNNRNSDSTPVTSANLLGIVYAVFNTDGVPAAAVAVADASPADVVFAAPAR